MVNTKNRKPERLQLLQFNKSVPTRIGIISLVGFSCAIFSLLLQFLNYGAIRGLSKKQLALVQLDDGKTITAKSVDENQRSPEVIKKFVGDTFTRMFSWDGLVKIYNDLGEPITKQDKGIDIDTASGKKKVTTKAYEAAFAISENQNFRAAFLQKLAQLTPSRIFEGNMQASLVPRYIGEPRLIRNGVWQVDIVATIVTFTTSDNTGQGITFNKTVTVEAVNTPQEITALTELSRKIYEARSAGLEITQINDLKTLIIMSLKNEHQNLTIDQILRFSEDTNDGQRREKPNREDSEEFPLITKHTVSTSPWSRLGIIAIPFGLGFLAIFYFLNGIFNPGRSPEPITAKADKTSPALEKVEQKDGDVYAKLALNKQEDELNKINQSKQEVKVNNKPVSVAASPPLSTARPVAQTQSPSPRRDYVPSRTNSTISSSPRNQILPRISNPVRTVTPITETPTDVIAEFNRLRSLGSYGKIAYTPTSNNQQISTEATSFQTPSTTRIQLQPPNSAYTTQQTRPNFSNSTPTEIEKIRPRWSANSKSDKQIADANYLPQENQILQQRKTRYLVVGEFANGVLVTSVVKQQSENRFQQQQNPDDSKRYVARLTADLHDNYGNVAIHKGTLLAVEPLQVNGGSYVSVQVTSIIKDNTEYPISSGAISVLGEGGKPLLAKQFQDHKGGGSDLTVALASGLGQVGAILNQSDSTSSVINSATGTFSSSTTSNSQRNIGGAFLQGAFGKLSDIITRRAETSNQQITPRPNVWYIPQGTKITFLVNRSLELP